MSGLDAFDEYLDRVKGAVLQIPFIKTFGIYPEIPAGFETPALFPEIRNWSQSDEAVPAQFSQSSCRVICICCVSLLQISTD